MPNKRGHQSRRKTPKKGSPMRSNQSSDHSEVNHFKLQVKRALPVPSRETSEDCSGVAYDGESPDQGCFDSCQEEIDEVIWRPLQNHNRMNSGGRYCLLNTVQEATKRGARFFPNQNGTLLILPT